MLSNLINNAVEALDDDGKVRLRILPSGNRLNIIIEDNGRGIPEDLLSKLGQRGNTFGKVGGSGLGLHHAIKVAESFSGKVAIESEIGKGTLVIIDLPRVAAPIWFVEHLELHSSSILVVLDDDPSIHQIWQGRIDSLNSSETKIRVEHFSTPNDLRSWVRTEALEHDFIFYLLDYELLGYKETGLDMAEELHLSRNSILVTSRYEEEFIKNRCINLSMPMIPKGMAGFVPIVVKSV